MLRTRNNTDGNKLVIFSGIALYYGDIYIITYMYLCFILLPDVYIYSLEWDEIQWRDIGDDGAIALTDLRVFNNFKILK